MLTKIRTFLARRDPGPPPAIPAGERVYAIGDIHGRLDLFEALIDRIEQDDAARGAARTTIVLLGDLVDRGRDSAGVIDRARRWRQQRAVEIIQGNHEEMLLASREDTAALRGFLTFGGMETLVSYGVDPHALATADMDEAQRLMIAAIPPADVDFIAGFRPSIAIGDYLFVHAGVRPRVPLDQQDERECRWIREPFLNHRGDFGAFVIHGHTISAEPEVCANRIGIDTGGYLYGTLTAIGLEGEDRWFLQASEGAERTESAPGSL